MRKVSIILLQSVLCLALFAACHCKKDPEPQPQPAQYLLGDEQRAMLDGLRKAGDRFYVLDYTCDYKLDEALALKDADLTSFIYTLSHGMLLQMPASDTLRSPWAGGCSGFWGKLQNGHFVYGRNYDGDSTANNFPILVHTHPAGGYEALAFADGGDFGFHKGGFPDDGTTDISPLVLAPYVLYDGINECGLAIGDYLVYGNAPKGSEAEYQLSNFTVMRLILDRCATVSEAIDMFKRTSVRCPVAMADMHFMVADSTGDYAIIEYVDDQVVVLRDNPCIGNYYHSPEAKKMKEQYILEKDFLVSNGMQHAADVIDTAVGFPCNYSFSCGLLRLRALCNAYNQHNGTFADIDEAMSTLYASFYSQTSARYLEIPWCTQWSNLYDLNARKVKTVVREKTAVSYTYGFEDFKR